MIDDGKTRIIRNIVLNEFIRMPKLRRPNLCDDDELRVILARKPTQWEPEPKPYYFETPVKPNPILDEEG